MRVEGGTNQNRIRVLGDKDHPIIVKVKKTLKNVLAGKNQVKRFKPIVDPRREGGGIVIEVDVEDYRRGVVEL